MAARIWNPTKEILGILLTVLITCVKGPYRPREIIYYIVHNGIYSLPVILASTAFGGLIVTTEMAFHMDRALHAVDMIPGCTGQFVFRSLGIAVPVLLYVAKVGASTTAEVGSMKVTEQIDALRLLHIDPVKYLVYPRFVAGIISVCCLTLLSIFVTLVCAIWVATLKYNFSTLEYLTALSHYISNKDLLWAMIKGMSYGAVIPVMSCYFGFKCEAGASGVGTATTKSVVASTILIIVMDSVLTYIFTQTF
jgi:phospholipid/cholesterol/gamma-HCH transport system permease protein